MFQWKIAGKLLLCVIALIPFCFFVSADTGVKSPQMYQASAFDIVESGNYSEVITVDEMKTYGDFGVGGFEDMDGELSQVDGNIYQIWHNGTVTKPSGDTGICFANTVHFNPEITREQNESLRNEALYDLLNESFPDDNLIYAYRIDGTFPDITVRSIPSQEEPYPPLSDVIADQATFHLQNVSGTASGFWYPRWMQGVNYAGFHTHFITDSRDAGGHVLDLTTGNVTISIQPIYTFTVILPEKKEI